MPHKECEICGKDFYVVPNKAQGARFCSMVCRTKGRRVEQKCETCGKEFSIIRSKLQYGWGKFCSRECIKAPKGSNPLRWVGNIPEGFPVEDLKRMYLEEKMGTTEIGKAMGLRSSTVRNYLHRAGVPVRTNVEAARLNAEKGTFAGPNNAQWTGGRKHRLGYVEIYCPDHPRTKGKYVGEHILVWEKAHGEYVLPGVEIHHLNGIKDDNRLENLAALDKSDHMRTHHHEPYKQRIRELEEQLRQLRS